MRNSKLIQVLLIAVVFFNSAIAKPLYIDITGGQNVGIPITILPFTNNGGHTIDGKTDIAKIVGADLSNSGQFRLIESNALERLDDVKFWRRKGSEHVISGVVSEEQNGSYEITFELKSVKALGFEEKLSLRFSGVEASNFRKLSHKISDHIFEKLTGISGVFSTQVAYISISTIEDINSHILVVADVDGHNPKNLVYTTFPLMSPSWSPDGRKIAFVSFEGHKHSIKSVDVSTGKVVTITETKGINSAPAWSSDGKKMAVVLSKDGAPKIYILDLQTKKLKRVTHGGYVDTEPTWMPDDSGIIFTSNRGGSPQIYHLDVETDKVKRLTFDGKYNTSPSVTKDGQQVVLLHKKRNGNYNVAVYSLITGTTKVITTNRYDESPSLAPNGMMVLYGTLMGGRYSLRMVSLDGKFHMDFPASGLHVKEPIWSPLIF